MNTYKVKITETLSKTFVVEAESTFDAEAVVMNNYYDSKDEYILTADDFENVYFKGERIRAIHHDTKDNQ